MSKIIAMVGARKTPDSIQEELIKIAKWCAENKIWLRSGKAISDYYFD